MNEKNEDKDEDYLEIGTKLSILDLKKIARGKVKVELSTQAREKIKKARRTLNKMIKKGKDVYGVTTGVGALEDTERSFKPKLGEKILRSHAAGVGEPLEEEIVRSMMALVANSLSKGYSGVREKIVSHLIKLLNEEIYPYVPQKGSVGSSGDLAPSAHIALTLIGDGEVIHDEKRKKSGKILTQKEISSLELGPREALAMINGTYLMDSLSIFNLSNTENLIASAEITTAMTYEALKAHKSSLNPHIHELRPHPGQIQTAKNLRALLEGSTLVDANNKHVQDPYSLRCSPQVIGSVRDASSFVRKIVKREINAITDNPIILSQESPQVISAGNFHGAPLALGQETLGTAIASLGNISERRTAKLMDETSDLPAFLTKEPGENSGLMLAQYTSAALVAKNKILSHPSNVDSIPTSAGQEDFNNFGSISARKTKTMIKNVENIIAIEALCAAQAIDLREGKDQLGQGTRKAYEIVRATIPFLEEDEKPLYQLLRAAKDLISSGKFVEGICEVVPMYDPPASTS